MTVSIDYVPAGDVARAFHLSNAFVRGLMGPVGSSKSSACCMEIFTRGVEQKPFNGVRRTRWAVIRATYPELKSTTIRTWQQWFPDQVAPMKWDAPISSMIRIPLPDGTKAEIEVLFFPVESPAEIEKLSSLEITGAWVNEARELPVDVLNKLTERVGRFPQTVWRGGDKECKHEAASWEDKCRLCGSVKIASPTWRGVIMDTNPPDDDGWWYGLAEGSDPQVMEQMAEIEHKMRELGYLKEGQKLYEFFKQPGGLIEVNGKLEPNPKAENIQNLDGGYAYYYRQAAGKKKNWIKAQVCGQYATFSSGRGVYDDHYNDEIHCKAVEPVRGLPIIVGQDYGRTPAAAICQITKSGQFRIIDEVVATGMGIRVFARDLLKPHLAQFYKDFQIIVVGDPSGMDGRDTEETTCFQILAEEGFAAVPALSNELNMRIESLSYYMDAMHGGEPCFLISPKAATIRKGLNGAYCFDRVQISGERFKDVPSKNKYSHPVEGAQYAAMHTKMVNVNDTWSKPLKYPERTGVV
jgi:hypothetical protein